MMLQCVRCGDDMDERRASIGYTTCLWCGEEAAKAERSNWCIVQEYGKGGYQFVTKERASQTVKQTNQKRQ